MTDRDRVLAELHDELCEHGPGCDGCLDEAVFERILDAGIALGLEEAADVVRAFNCKKPGCEVAEFMGQAEAEIRALASPAQPAAEGDPGQDRASAIRAIAEQLAAAEGWPITDSMLDALGLAFEAGQDPGQGES